MSLFQLHLPACSSVCYINIFKINLNVNNLNTFIYSLINYAVSSFTRSRYNGKSKQNKIKWVCLVPVKYPPSSCSSCSASFNSSFSSKTGKLISDEDSSFILKTKQSLDEMPFNAHNHNWYVSPNSNTHNHNWFDSSNFKHQSKTENNNVIFWNSNIFSNWQTSYKLMSF